MKSQYITPVVTVFDDKGQIDNEQNLQVYQFLNNKVSGFVVMGSTGEFFSLNMHASKQLIKLCSTAPREHMKIYAGASRMDIQESIELANYADEMGLDGVMIISPYYFPLTQEAIYDFYSTIASQTRAKIFIYNFPDRTGYSIAPQTCLKLADKYPHIVGLKDTILDTIHTCEVINLVKKEIPNFQVFSGFDNNFAHNILAGGNGCIGGLSNIVPEFFASWMDAFAQNNLASIAQHQKTVDQLMAVYNVNNPFISTLKKALQLRGVIRSDRSYPPFNCLDDSQVKLLRGILENANVQLKK
ncbi:dihydrodipicolinate synthase family protein [Commensalibacter oyaizuii]|uniref:Dihydrodipicolinate synthase family protein n=1 Tax=Commensalibacter oyaizuii TaxID=3043873 RepID=A0ABT6Q2X0_9PROT|nr:dihydrodipicolinate synthase family protein [Commensalibacter sp. TBRC 16381]MDI2091457.1 dihydrodipicolinate synthase family protein [Commensalibacter sp. TBRC 16381]